MEQKSKFFWEGEELEVVIIDKEHEMFAEVSRRPYYVLIDTDAKKIFVYIHPPRYRQDYDWDDIEGSIMVQANEGGFRPLRCKTKCSCGKAIEHSAYSTMSMCDDCKSDYYNSDGYEKSQAFLMAGCPE